MNDIISQKHLERPTISSLLHQAKNPSSIPAFEDSHSLQQTARKTLTTDIPDALNQWVSDKGIHTYLDSLKSFDFRLIKEENSDGWEVLFRNVSLNHSSFLFSDNHIYQIHTDTGEKVNQWDSISGFHDYLFKNHFTFSYQEKSIEFAKLFLDIEVESLLPDDDVLSPNDNIAVFCSMNSSKMGAGFMLMNRLLVYGKNRDTWVVCTTTDTQKTVDVPSGDDHLFLSLIADAMLYGKIQPEFTDSEEKRLSVLEDLHSLFDRVMRDHYAIEEQREMQDLEFFSGFDENNIFPFMPEPPQDEYHWDIDEINLQLSQSKDEMDDTWYYDFDSMDNSYLDPDSDLNYNEPPQEIPIRIMTEQERLEDLNIHTEAFFRALFFSRSTKMCPKSISYQDSASCSDVMRVVLETKTGEKINLFVSGYGGTCWDQNGNLKNHSNFSDLIQTVLRLQGVNMTDGVFTSMLKIYEDCYPQYRKQLGILQQSHDFTQSRLKSAFKDGHDGFTLESLFALFKQKGIDEYRSVMGVENVYFNDDKQRDEYIVFGYPIRFSGNRFVINSEIVNFKNNMNKQDGLNALLETIQDKSGQDMVSLRTSWKHFIEKVVLPYYAEFQPKNLEKLIPEPELSDPDDHYIPNGSLSNIVLPIGLAEPDDNERDDLIETENWQQDLGLLTEYQIEEREMEQYTENEELNIVGIPPYSPPPEPKVVEPPLMMPLDDWEQENIADMDKAAWQAYRSNHFSPDNRVVKEFFDELAQIRFQYIEQRMAITNTEIFHRFKPESMIEVLQQHRMLALLAHPDRDDVWLVNSIKMGLNQAVLHKADFDQLKNGMELLNFFGQLGFDRNLSHYEQVKRDFEKVLREAALEKCRNKIVVEMEDYHRKQIEHLKSLEMEKDVPTVTPSVSELAEPVQSVTHTGISSRPKSDAVVIQVLESDGFPQTLPNTYLADSDSEFYRRMKADPESAKGDLRPYLYSSKVRMNSQCELIPSFNDFLYEINSLLRHKGKPPLIYRIDFETNREKRSWGGGEMTLNLENGRSVFFISQHEINGKYIEHWRLEKGSCRYMDESGDSLSHLVRFLLHETNKSHFISDAEINFCASRALINTFLQHYPLTAVLDDLAVSAKMQGSHSRIYEMANGARFSYTHSPSGELATAFNRGQASAINSIRLMQILLAWEHGLPTDKDSLNANKEVTGYRLGKEKLLEHHLSLNPQRQQMVLNDFGSISALNEKGMTSTSLPDKQEQLSSNLPERSAKQDLMMAYLAKRNIPDEVIASNLNSMYQGRYERPGKTGEVVVFMTGNSAAVRGCTPQTDHVKETVPGSVLDKPYAMNPCSRYWHNSKDNVHRIAVVEAGIDCLSYLTCFPLDHVHALFGLNTKHLLNALKELPQVAPMDGRVQLIYACDNTLLDENNQAYDEGSRNTYFELIKNMSRHCYQKFITETDNEHYRFDRAENCLRHLIPFIRDKYLDDADDIINSVRNEIGEVVGEHEFEQLLGKALFEAEYVKTGVFAVRTPYHPQYGMFKDWNDMLCNIVKIEQEKHPDKPAKEILLGIQQYFSPECEITKHHSLYCDPSPSAGLSRKP